MPNKQNTISPEEKKILNKCYWGSLSCMRTTSNVVGQGRAMVLSTAPVIEKYYQDDEAKKEALTRHASEYINTNQTMYGLLAGIACAMEKERAEKGNVEPGTITSVIASLMGPLAGIGDSFFFNCVRVIVAGIAIGIAADGNLLGPLLFVALFGFGLLALKYVLFMTGLPHRHLFDRSGFGIRHYFYADGSCRHSGCHDGRCSDCFQYQDQHCSGTGGQRRRNQHSGHSGQCDAWSAQACSLVG